MTYTKYIQCAECGRKILTSNAHCINGKAYGYGCYKKQLALLYKQYEDEKNAEYSAKCFAAMQIFEGKKSNSFHDSICNQWNNYKKLTARQLECIIKGFTDQENIKFWIIWQQITNDETLKRSISVWVENEIKNFSNYIGNEEVIDCLLCNPIYKHGFHFLHDKEDTKVFIMKNGRNNKCLNENVEDEEVEVLKVVKGKM